MHPTGPGSHPITTDQISFALDWLNREVILVPDPIARRMEAERKNGWQEALGWGWGKSREFPTGTWMHEVLTTLIAAYGDSPIPAELTGENRVWAEQHRRFAKHYGDQRPVVVGVGDFNPDTRQWINYPANPDLHPFGWASRDPHTGAYTLAG